MGNDKSNHLPEGTKIGHLKVLYRARSGKSYYYHCECDCGSTTNVDATKLEQRKQTACLCKGKFLEIGKTYDRLTVRERVGRGFYRCDCACGKKNVIVQTSDVLSGNIRSCGCANRPYNRNVRKDSSTGIRGVSINRKTGKYYVFIHQDGRNRYLGSFTDLEEARRVRIKAEKQMEQRVQKSQT